MPRPPIGPPLLDPREMHFRIPSPRPGLKLFLRRLSPRAGGTAPAVLYVHGATFPSALSIAHRFGAGRSGRSWRDALCEAGLDVWSLDFLGYGASDRYPEMAAPADAHPPLGTVEDAAAQVRAALGFVRERTKRERVALIAHSWGTMPAAAAAGETPTLVDRLLLFGPIAPRRPTVRASPPSLPAWREVTVAEQRARFVADVPAGEVPVLVAAEFAAWGTRYLDSDPGSRAREPAAVRIPAGPAADIARAWTGEWRWDPTLIRRPVAVLRGEWDSLTTDIDARTLLDAMTAAPARHDIALRRGTHLMHLEAGRTALHAASVEFLSG